MNECIPSSLRQLTMEVLVLGCLLLSDWTGVSSAAQLLEDLKEPGAGVHAMKGESFNNITEGGRVKRDDYTKKFLELLGSTNLVAYQGIGSPEVRTFATELKSSISLLQFHIYNEITMLERVDLEINSTRNRCQDCCTLTPYDPTRPIMRKEEGAGIADQPQQNCTFTAWPKSLGSGLEANKTGHSGKEYLPTIEQCSNCCMLRVVQKVKRL